MDVPEEVEAVWIMMKSRQNNQSTPLPYICACSVYISPRSNFKTETTEHIIESIHCIRVKYNNEVKCIIRGDFNRTKLTDILDSYGALSQIMSIPTNKKGGTLEIILTDLHHLFVPPTSLPPLPVDVGKKGVESDHNTIVFAPKEFFFSV